MSYMLPHLHNGWQVDQAILSEEDRVVVSRKEISIFEKDRPFVSGVHRTELIKNFCFIV